MDPTEKPLIVIVLGETGPTICIVKEAAQPGAAVSCRACGTTLTSEASKAAGIGPICAKKEKAKEKKPESAGEDHGQLKLDMADVTAKRKPDSWQYFLERNADALRGR